MQVHECFPCMVELPVFVAERFSWYICFGMTIHLSWSNPQGFYMEYKGKFILHCSWKCCFNWRNVQPVRSINRHGNQDIHVSRSECKTIYTKYGFLDISKQWNRFWYASLYLFFSIMKFQSNLFTRTPGRIVFLVVQKLGYPTSSPGASISAQTSINFPMKCSTR
jgi:hypothetical protein